MKDLRKLARGRDCQLRLPGICNWNPETTVLCHIRRAGNAGVGQKPIHLCAVIACSDCHDVLDRRRKSDLSNAELDEYTLDALCRTLGIWAREGLV
jgi:hypothetical protein